MTRAISILLIVAISLQTIGCSTWKHLARASEATEDESQSTMRDQVIGELKKGMAVRIGIMEGTHLPIKGRVIDCIIENIGQTSLTLIPIMDHIRGTVKREFRLRYSDIVSIEYRESDDSKVFVTGLAAGAVLGILLLRVVLSGIELD
ncbi:MAG: hypothetical protein OXH06_14240 [Gemmatimonadetes bacterium]|nr:hypothetical protein [Gemmatimonadota bacterium]